jgi:hypothetical protein
MTVRIVNDLYLVNQFGGKIAVEFNDYYNSLIGNEFEILTEHDEKHYLKSFSNISGSIHTQYVVSKLPINYIGMDNYKTCYRVPSYIDENTYMFPTFDTFQDALRHKANKI